MHVSSKHCRKSTSDQLLTMAALEAAANASKDGGIQRFVIVSNDQDFVPLYSKLKQKGITAISACYASQGCFEAKRAAASIVELPPPSKKRRLLALPQPAGTPGMSLPAPVQQLSMPAPLLQIEDPPDQAHSHQRSQVPALGAGTADTELKALAKQLKRAELAQALAVRMMSPATACQQLALHVESFCLVTFSWLLKAMMADLPGMLATYHSPKNKSGIFKRLVLAGLRGTLTWSAVELRCIVDLLLLGPRGVKLPNLPMRVAGQIGFALQVRQLSLCCIHHQNTHCHTLQLQCFLLAPHTSCVSRACACTQTQTGCCHKVFESAP